MNKPQIRFKGFESELKLHTLADLGSWSKGQPLSKSDIGNGPYPCIHYGELFSYPEFISKVNSHTFIEPTCTSKGCELLFPDSDVTPTGLGRCCSISETGVILGTGINILSLKSGLDSHYCALNVVRNKSQIIERVSGTTVRHINPKNLNEVVISISPDLLEQSIIGNYFRQLDEMIVEVEREISRLEKIKQASLQNIFPRPGAATPEIRFAGFSEPWEDRRLDSLSTIFGRIGFRGYTVADIVPKGMGAISLSPTNLIGTNSVQYNTQTTYISNSKYLESPEIMIFPGDVVFVKTASVGRVAYIDHIICDTTLNPQLVVLKKLSCNGRFLSLAMATSEFQDKILGIAGGGVLKTLSQIKLGELTVKMPSLKEQNAIGEYFRNLDALISTKRQKFTKLRNIKQACLDKMFINTSEL